MDSPKQPLSRKLMVKIFLKVVFGTIILSTVIIFSSYDEVDVKLLVNILAVFIIVAGVTSLVMWRYISYFHKHPRTIGRMFVGIGVAMIIVESVLVFIFKEGGHYFQLGVGVMFVILGMRKLKTGRH